MKPRAAGFDGRGALGLMPPLASIATDHRQRRHRLAEALNLLRHAVFDDGEVPRRRESENVARQSCTVNSIAGRIGGGAGAEVARPWHRTRAAPPASTSPS